MRIPTVLLVAVLVLGAVGGPAVGVAAADVTLTVSVKTAAGGSVGSADLHASWDGGSTTATTASNGKAFVDVPEGADVSIEVDHPIYVRNAPFEITDASEREVEVTVWEKATASVTVADRNGPVEDAQVVFRKGSVVADLTTDEAGQVDTGVIESGQYTVSVVKPGYYEKTAVLEVRDDTSEEIRIERGSVTVEFRVLDDHFDPPEPISEAAISASDFSTVTQPDGSRAVSVPVNTQLTVTVKKDGYETIRRLVFVREADQRVNITTRRQSAVQIGVANERVVAGETVQVMVTDEYGDPLPEATVYLDGEALGQVDDEGALRVMIESAGEHALFAQAGQLSSEQLVVTGIEPDGGNIGGASLAEAADSDTQVSGLFVLPAIGPLHLRSVAIGAAAGLLLAGMLFVYVRFG